MTMQSFMLLPSEPALRKMFPMTTGLLDYFPRALAAVALTSYVGNEQHNPGQPLHWAKEKSRDHADCIPRHLADRASLDTDGVPHRFKLAWRSLADLETYLEERPGFLEEVARMIHEGKQKARAAEEGLRGEWIRVSDAPPPPRVCDEPFGPLPGTPPKGWKPGRSWMEIMAESGKLNYVKPGEE